MEHLEKIDTTPGQIIFKEGEPSNELYFVATGKLIASRNLKQNHVQKRLRSMGSGTVFGEMGLYLGIPRSATITVEEAGVIYRLSNDSLKKVEETNKELANEIHRCFIRLLSDRLMHTTDELTYLIS